MEAALALTGALALFWYLLVPAAGAIAESILWRRFRARFRALAARPRLTFAGAQALGEYRCAGSFELAPDGGTLWVRNQGLTTPVRLAGARVFALQGAGGGEEPDPGETVPLRIRGNRLFSLPGEAEVFVGGPLIERNARFMFASLPGKPLLIIFYEGPERAMAIRAARAGWSRNEYFNTLTPYAIILGAFCQIILALSYATRPAFHLAMAYSFGALFIPLYPFLPPGLFFTIVSRRLSWLARLHRARRDAALLAGSEWSGGAAPAIPTSAVPLAGMEPAQRSQVRAYLLLCSALVLIAAGLGINLILIGFLFRFLGGN